MGINNWMSTFEAYAQHLLDGALAPGAVIAVAKNGELFYEKTFGYRDREKKLPINLDTVFGIASITKSFTSMAIMQLQEHGKLSVHDPVVKYLPEFRTPDESHTKTVTIHHFMTHTLGFPPLSSWGPIMLRSIREDQEDPAAKELLQQPFIVGKQPIDTFEQLMEYIEQQSFELLGPPGTEFSYSNDAYGLLGAIIERVSGKSYETYVKEHILEPSSMERSLFFLDELGDENHAVLYSRRMVDGSEEVYRSPLRWNAPAMRASGALSSSARDMLRYAELIRTGGLSAGNRTISQPSVAQMAAPHAPIDGHRSYGYGLVVQPIMENHTLLHHTGGMKGVSSHMFIVPETGITGIVLINVKDAPALELTLGLLNSLYSRSLDTPFATYADYEPKVNFVQQCQGTFKSDEGDTITIRFDDIAKQLFITSRSENLPLRPIGEDTFLLSMKGIDTPIRFVRGRNGNIKRVAFGSRQLPKVLT